MAPSNCQPLLFISLFSFIIFNSAQALCVPRNASWNLPFPSTKSSPNSPTSASHSEPKQEPEPNPHPQPSKLEPPPTSMHPEPSLPEPPPIPLPIPGPRDPQGPPLSQSPQPPAWSKKEPEPEPDQGSSPDSPSDNIAQDPESPRTLLPGTDPPKDTRKPMQPYITDVDPGIKQICDHTDYPDICISTVFPSLKTHDKNDITAVLGTTMRAGMDMANVAMSTADKLANVPGTSPEKADILSVCSDSYDDSMDNFQKALDALPGHDTGTMNTMLSAVITNVGDCQDAFEGEPSPVSEFSDKLHKMASNSLAMVSLYH